MHRISCICTLALKDAVNTAMDAAGLSSGMSIPIRKNPNATQTHCQQHVWGTAEDVAAYEAIPGLFVKAEVGEYTQSAETCVAHMNEHGLSRMPD